MKTRKSKAIQTEVVKRDQVLALAARDKRKHTSHYKKEPMAAGLVAVSKFIMMDGQPHKMVSGVLVPLTKKA